MPLLGPTSYPSTLRLFLAHWAHVNARLGAGHELVLPDGLGLAAVQALETELEDRMDAVSGPGVEVSQQRASLQIGRKALRARLGQFCDLVRAYWHGTPWAALVPKLPPASVAPDRFLMPAREALRLWTLLEAEPAPAGAPVPIFLDPEGTYGRAEFAAEVAAVTASALAVEDALWVRSVALARRNAVMKRVKLALMAYQRAVPGRLPAANALIASMPALWPPPGHTPDAVAVSGTWDAAANGARLTWEASGDKMLDHYELRVCEGPEYDRELEKVLARVPPGEPRELVTDSLPARPGTLAAFRLYVVLTTGNERGSKTVVVERPAG